MGKPVAQIFISYAHLDNAKLQGYEMGWVDRLYNALEIELPTHGIEVRWWRDKRDLYPESYFDESILAAVSNSDAFLAILSPAYPQRPFCIKELNHFLNDLRAGTVEQQRRRVLKVFRRPITDPEISRILPESISESGGFCFYSEDRQTKKVLLYIRPNGEIARPEFWDTMEDLAEAIARTVNKSRPRLQISPMDLAVYVAESSEDQDHNYRTIRSELIANGFRVLPDRRVPDDFREAVGFIDEHLSRSIMSVHLLGERSGYIPVAPRGEPSKPITQLQLDRAEARSNADPAFRRFIWVRDGVKATQDDQQSLLATFKDGTALLSGDDFVTEPLELFKNVILDYLRRRVLLSATKLPARHTILLIAHTADRDSADGLAAALQRAEYKVSSLYLDDSLGPEEEARIARLAGQTDVALVLYTPAADAWARNITGKLYTVSAARDDLRPNIRAVVASNGTALEGFGTPYCNLVLISGPESWDQVTKGLQMRIGGAPPL